MHDETRTFDPADWHQALAAWRHTEATAAAEAEDRQPVLAGRIPAGWWLEAFANPPTPGEIRGHRCGAAEMLTIVAYDISDPKRLSNVAKHCADYGLRVQYSIFECRMEADMFDRFWEELGDLIDPAADRVVAYKICAQCAKGIAGLGTMVHQEKVVAYVF